MRGVESKIFLFQFLIFNFFMYICKNSISMSLIINYRELQNKYSSKKRKCVDDLTNLNIGKEFMTASQWVDYKELGKSKKKKNGRKNKKIKSYKELLKDKRWEKKRIDILNKKGCVCSKCGSTENLQVHHLYYDKSKNPWNYPDDAFIVLCKKCHEEIHGIS